MPRIADRVEIMQKSIQKQQLEQTLTNKVYDQFNKGEPLQALRATAKAALRSMYEGPHEPLRHALVEERFLSVHEHYKPLHNMLQAFNDKDAAKAAIKRKQPGDVRDFKGGILGLLTQARRFSAVDCGDVIRLAGAWVEFGGFQTAWGGNTGRSLPARTWMEDGKKKRVGARKITAAEEVQTAYRGGAGKRGKRSSTFEAKAGTWGQGPGKGLDDHEDRLVEALYTTDPKQPKRLHDMAARRTREKNSGKRLPFPLKKRPEHTGVAGRQLKRIPRDANDNTLKIDRLFGLRDVCSISGTTADLTFALEVWGHKSVNKVADLSRTYYVLPIGSIAAFHHHSLLEVALVLSLNGVVDYRIGFYDSLLPKDRYSPSCRRQLANALLTAKMNMRSQGLHFLRFYEGGRLAGGIVFEGDDVDWLESSRIPLATNVLWQILNMKRYPEFGDVARFCQRSDPGFYHSVLYPTVVQQVL